MDRYPCCGALVGMWHMETCFERQEFPDDEIDRFESEFGAMRVVVKRGPTYLALKNAPPIR